LRFLTSYSASANVSWSISVFPALGNAILPYLTSFSEMP
jgi:hypothetical protein